MSILTDLNRNCKYCGVNKSLPQWHKNKWTRDLGWYCHQCYYSIWLAEHKGRWNKHGVWSKHRDRSGKWEQISKYKHSRVLKNIYI